MVLELFGKQVLPGNLKFLLNKVTCNLNKFHPVPKCRADCGKGIGGCYEEHL